MDETDGTICAARHALGWLVFGNSVGMLLSILLLKPEWQPGNFSYGHWIPLHLNAQLYGWTALPLVGWLMKLYEVNSTRFRAWGPAAIWAWTAALMLACYQWLNGETSGKIFLDWRNSSLWGFVMALILLWAILLVSFIARSSEWRKLRCRLSLAGLIGLAAVPVIMLVAASPRTYPPIDRTTGGPTGSSLLGSTLIVIGLMLLLPRAIAVDGRGKAGLGTWIFFGISWIVFGVTEAIGGSHFDSWQIGSMLMLLPWAWLIPRDWSGFKWPQSTRPWRRAMLFWWALLVISGVLMYSPGILDHIKFTQALVAHSHLAMAGFTTSFCAMILCILTQRSIGGPRSVLLWNVATFSMVFVLAAMGWREGNGADWMIVHAGWRETGMILRSFCGALMLGTSISWMIQFSKS